MPPKTFKQRVHEAPHKYLTLRDDIYLNRKTFTWQRLYSYDDVNWEQIHELYDLSNLRFMYKVPVPFESSLATLSSTNSAAHMVFKEIADGGEVDMSRVLPALRSSGGTVLYRIAYPNAYGILNNLLLIIPEDEWDILDDVQREHYITINAYVNLVLRKCVHRTWDDIDAAPALSEHVMHWVWFRKPGYRLPAEMAERVASWVRHNPEMTFTLWTDLSGADELVDFVADAGPAWTGDLQDRVHVKFLADTLAFAREYFERHHEPALQAFDQRAFLDLIESRAYNRTLIAKTDFLRSMILHDQGGFYSDFNDCECFVPMRYWFRELEQAAPDGRLEILLPCDTFNAEQISNYFIYVPQGSHTFERLHFQTLPGFEGVKRCFMDAETPRKVTAMYWKYARKFWKRLLETRTYEPTQLLTDVVFPAYENCQFTDALSGVITAVGVQGLARCDSRPKVFLPMFFFKHIAEKHDLPALADFFDHMVSEFKQVGMIRLRRAPLEHTAEYTSKYEVVPINPAHSEDWDEQDALYRIHDRVLSLLDDVLVDEELVAMFYREFIKQLVFVTVNMTNFMMHVERELGRQLTFNELVPMSFVYLNMTHVTLIGHYGHGTSIGIEK